MIVLEFQHESQLLDARGSIDGVERQCQREVTLRICRRVGDRAAARCDAIGTTVLIITAAPTRADREETRAVGGAGAFGSTSDGRDEVRHACGAPARV